MRIQAHIGKIEHVTSTLTSSPYHHILLRNTGVKKQKTIPSSISVPVPASVLKEDAAPKGSNMTPGKKNKNKDGNGGDKKRKHYAEKE